MSWLWVVLVACGDGLEATTLVDDVQILAVVAEPPEATPGSQLSLAIEVADPLLRGADLLVWSCTDLGGGCLEAGPPSTPLGAFTAVVRDVGPTTDVAFTIPELADDLLTPERPTLTFLVWTVACGPDLCPIIDEVAADPVAGSPAWRAVVEELRDPRDWIAELPFEGSAVAYRRVTLSVRDSAQRNRNPSLTPLFVEPLVIERRQALELRFATDGAEKVLVWTTGGAFETGRYSVREAMVSMQWTAPITPGEVTLWAVAQDGLGGVARWRGTAEVR